jgi:hypothetical protein
MGGLFVLVIAVVISALFLHVGTAVAGIAGRSFGKALGAVVVGAIASGLISGAIKLFGVTPGLFSLVFLTVVSLFIVKSVFSTTWGRAIVAALIHGMLTVVFIGLPLMFFVFSALGTMR